MLWFIFSILTAFFESLKDVFSKLSLKHVDVYMVSWSYRFFSLPFLLPLLLFIPIPALGGLFWPALIAATCTVTITTILYMKAIQHSDISITVPIVSFTPLFLLITSPLIVGEFPNIFGLIGVLFIVIGSFTLNIGEGGKGVLARSGRC